jgi:hypothetical protein
MALMKLESWSYIRKRYLWPLADVIGYRPGRSVAMRLRRSAASIMWVLTSWNLDFGLGFGFVDWIFFLMSFWYP